MAKNTEQGRRIGAVRSRNEFKVGKTWYKRDATDRSHLNGSPR
jgi:hypothetical protein